MSSDAGSQSGSGIYSGQRMDGRPDHIREYKKNEFKNRYAQLLNDVMLGDANVRKVMEYLHESRKNMESVSYENRNGFTVVPEDVAADTGLSKRAANNILSMLSTKDFPVMRREGFKAYSLTDVGDACLSDISYRKNMDELARLSGPEKAQ